MKFLIHHFKFPVIPKGISSLPIVFCGTAILGCAPIPITSRQSQVASHHFSHLPGDARLGVN
jgi:hypothetical protein